ncbi:MAG: T9SS type A sorting domain-containing protein [Chitinophagales bacterium]
MRYTTANINAKLAATILMMVVLVLVNTNATARPNFKMKTKQAETTTNIAFKVPQNTKVWMNVYDMEGRYIAELMNEKRVLKGKTQNVEVNTTNWSGGTYKVEVRTASGKVWTEMLVISR